MATEQNIVITKGSTGTIVVTVTGVSSWTGLLAKLFASDVRGNAPVITLTGVIDGANNKITFTYAYSDTASLTKSPLHYDVIIYKTDKSYIKTTNYGLLGLATPVKLDPTT
jgi:hypothetical protein